MARRRILGASGASQAGPGHDATSPAQIPWAGWRSVIGRALSEMITDQLSLVAAGCAFYATLALFPAISMLVSIYGLVFDPATVEPQLAVLRDLLPPSAYTLIDDRIHMLVSKPQGALTISLLISVAITLWSASTGTKSIITALNIAYEETERRPFLRYQMTALGMTLCALIGAVLAIAGLVALPAFLAFLGLPSGQDALARVLSLLILVGFVSIALSLLYRFGPCRTTPRWHWVTPGSALATLLWLIASVLFSYYVGHIATYDATYGPLGAVVGVMMWFWVSVFVVLLGAELNAELELQTAKDSTEGPERPMGDRGAYVADHVAHG